MNVSGDAASFVQVAGCWNANMESGEPEPRRADVHFTFRVNLLPLSAQLSAAADALGHPFYRPAVRTAPRGPGWDANGSPVE